MKIQVSSNLLQKKLPFINHAISSKIQLPVLSHFLLETQEQNLIIKATDLEIGIQVQLVSKNEEQGAITVPAKVFSELVASLPQEEIILQTKDKLLEITSKKTKSTLQTIAKEEFPRLYEEKGDEILKISQNIIQKTFEKVALAASLDNTRPALSAVMLKKQGDLYVLVATDGYRLSLINLGFKEKKEKFEQSLLIPARIIKELSYVKDEGSDIGFFVSEKNNQIIFSTQDSLLIGRLIEADFPNYEKIIPSDFETEVQFDKEELQKAVKLCSIFARETANIVKLAIEKDTIIVSANTPSVGENRVEVEATVKGEQNEIAFNARYVLDLLSHVEEEEMVFQMTGPLNPGVFKIQNNTSFLHLIMPIRVQS